MKRDIYSKLIKWKEKPKRKPLIIQGARQVGKTFLMLGFASKEFAHHVYVNFEEDPKLHYLFAESLEPKKIVSSLEIYFERKIDLKTTVIIFDEIQSCPNALNSLKYFSEKLPSSFIISAGSLLGIMFNSRGSFPVGKVEFMELYPMTFFEFLVGTKNLELREHLLSINSIEPIPKIIHEKALKIFKEYMLVGGMPEVVKHYSENSNLLDARQIQKNIEKAYMLDFVKHAPSSQVQKITTIWEQIPKQLSKENKKFVFSLIRKSARAREYETAIKWLIDAGLILKASLINTPKIPLKAYTDNHAFKIYVLDIGILCAIADLPIKTMLLEQHSIFKEFKGALTENYVAQTLNASTNNNLFYWKSEGIAEIDFIIQLNSQIFPLEVKAGLSTKSKSINVYSKIHEPALLLRTSTNNLKQDGQYINCPLYLIEILPMLLERF
jgi:predicted AAA+ superfamily ATPase